MKSIAVFFFFIVLSTSVSAQWSADSTVNNLLATSGSNNVNIDMVTDGNDGAIFGWIDFDSANLYIQRVNSNGVPQWPSGNPTEGILVDNLGDLFNSTGYNLISDGNNGIIIVWDYASDYTDKIYVQKYNSAGEAQWAAGDSGHAVEVSNRPSSQFSPELCTDGAGGAIITWSDILFTDEDNDSIEVFAQKINSDGVVQWTASGKQVTNTFENEELNLKLISDNSGGAIAVYTSGNDADIEAQRLDSDGNSLWNVVTQASAVQVIIFNYPKAVQAISDGSGGVIIAWLDMRNDFADIYTQRIESDGSFWSVDGVPVSTAIYEQVAPVLVPDGNGGAIIAWEDFRANDFANIYAQRINSAGSPVWTPDGIRISANDDDQMLVDMVSVPGNSAVIVWQSGGCVCSNSDVLVQKINPDSTFAWVVDGIGVAKGPDAQNNPAVVSDGADGVIIVWDDYRNDAFDGDIYGSHVNSEGFLPVELSSFTASVNGSNVILNWSTSSEVNNYRFEIERLKDSKIKRSKDSNPEWELVGFVDGHGNSSSVRNYLYEDKNIEKGNYLYRLKQIDKDGSFTYSDEVAVSFMNPADFMLTQNYPNPFNPETRIDYQLPAESNVVIKLFDILGNEVSTLINEKQEAGFYTVAFNGNNLAAGTYIYRITAGNFTKTMKMILMK